MTSSFPVFNSRILSILGIPSYVRLLSSPPEGGRGEDGYQCPVSLSLGEDAVKIVDDQRPSLVSEKTKKGDK